VNIEIKFLGNELGKAIREESERGRRWNENCKMKGKQG